MTTITIVIEGEAQPAGSKRAIPRKGGGKPIVLDANPNSAAWKNLVRESAARQLDGTPPLQGPLTVQAAIYRPRPKGHYTPSGSLSSAGRRTPYPVTRPDTTKLWRGTEDALTGLVWVDDSQIVDQRVMKLYGVPRVIIQISTLDTT